MYPGWLEVTSTGLYRKEPAQVFGARGKQIQTSGLLSFSYITFGEPSKQCSGLGMSPDNSWSGCVELGGSMLRETTLLWGALLRACMAAPGLRSDRGQIQSPSQQTRFSYLIGGTTIYNISTIGCPL